MGSSLSLYLDGKLPSIELLQSSLNNFKPPSVDILNTNNDHYFLIYKFHTQSSILNEANVLESPTTEINLDTYSLSSSACYLVVLLWKMGKALPTYKHNNSESIEPAHLNTKGLSHLFQSMKTKLDLDGLVAPFSHSGFWMPLTHGNYLKGNYSLYLWKGKKCSPLVEAFSISKALLFEHTYLSNRQNFCNLFLFLAHRSSLKRINLGSSKEGDNISQNFSDIHLFSLLSSEMKRTSKKIYLIETNHDSKQSEEKTDFFAPCTNCRQIPDRDSEDDDWKPSFLYQKQESTIQPNPESKNSPTPPQTIVRKTSNLPKLKEDSPRFSSATSFDDICKNNPNIRLQSLARSLDSSIPFSPDNTVNTLQKTGLSLEDLDEQHSFSCRLNKPVIPPISPILPPKHCPDSDMEVKPNERELHQDEEMSERITPSLKLNPAALLPKETYSFPNNIQSIEQDMEQSTQELEKENMQQDTHEFGNERPQTRGSQRPKISLSENMQQDTHEFGNERPQTRESQRPKISLSENMQQDTHEFGNERPQTRGSQRPKISLSLPIDKISPPETRKQKISLNLHGLRPQNSKECISEVTKKQKTETPGNRFNLKLNSDDPNEEPPIDWDELKVNPSKICGINWDLVDMRNKLKFFGDICSSICEDWLFLSGEIPSQNFDYLKTHKITHVINCASSVCENYFPTKVTYLALDLYDDGLHENLLSFFTMITDFLQNVKKTKGHVLIHCQQGVSRSSSFIIAYLIWANNWNFMKAHEFCKDIRPIVNPNAGFMTQLMTWQKSLVESNSILLRISMHKTFLLCVPKLEKTARNLDPRFSYLIIDNKVPSPGCIWVWIGSQAFPLLKKWAEFHAITYKRTHQTLKKIVTVFQGKEPPMFWEACPNTNDLDGPSSTMPLSALDSEVQMLSSITAFKYPGWNNVFSFSTDKKLALPSDEIWLFLPGTNKKTVYFWVGPSARIVLKNGNKKRTPNKLPLKKLECLMEKMEKIFLKKHPNYTDRADFSMIPGKVTLPFNYFSFLKK